MNKNQIIDAIETLIEQSWGGYHMSDSDIKKAEQAIELINKALKGVK